MSPANPVRHWLIRLLRARRGTTALEFGMIAFPLMMLTFGVIEYARLIWTNEVLLQTATATARCMGVLAPSCSTGGVYSLSMTNTYAQQQLNNAQILISNTTLTPTYGTRCAGIPGFSQVSISYTFHTLVPLVLTPLANGIQLTAAACFPNQS